MYLTDFMYRIRLYPPKFLMYTKRRQTESRVRTVLVTRVVVLELILKQLLNLISFDRGTHFIT